MLALSPEAGAIDVSLIGLAEDTAVVIIDDGRPRTLRIGQTGPGGVRLISAGEDHAVIEVDGERRRLTLGETVYAAPQVTGRPSITLTSDGSGHFFASGAINGATMRFLVDTGASLVAMGVSDARRAGVNYLDGEKAYANTANGVATVFRVRLDSVRVGDITLSNVDAMVHPATDLPVVLLGMSFLGQFNMNRDGDRLTLTQRY